MHGSVKGIDKLKMQRSRGAGHYARRLFGPHSNRRCRSGTACCAKLIEAFYRKTGCPVVVNTSFNLGWDPIVCSPKEAYDTFMASDIDVLCMGHYVLTKPAQQAFVAAAPATTIATNR